MITVVGAGPVGCFIAYLLAKDGQKVQILEEHKTVGYPVHCTGLVTSSINKILKIPKSVVVNEISKAKIFAVKNDFVELNFKENNLVLDRQKLDQFIAGKAIGEGVKILLGHRFVRSKGRKIFVQRNGKTVQLETDILIGADGSLSQVAKANGLWGNRSFWLGMQVRAKCENDNSIEFYPTVGTFGWLVPENEGIVRIGILAKSDAKGIMQAFLNSRLRKAIVIDKQAGLVPIYNPKVCTQKNNVFLVGDAATHVKATTGGGIVPGLIAAQSLAHSILKGKTYWHESFWKISIGRSLRMHLMLRKILDRFNNEDYNKLVSLCSSQKAKKVLAEVDRDNLKSLVFSLIYAEPRLLYFLKYFFL